MRWLIGYSTCEATRADLEADARGNYLREVQDLGPATDDALRIAIERN